MSKSLEQKLSEKIKEIYKILEEQNIIVTESKLIDELKKLKEYKKTPEAILKRNITQTMNQMNNESDKKGKNAKKSLNNQLPYVKKALQSQQKQQQDEDSGDEIDKQIKDIITKKVKTGNDQQADGITTDLDQIIGVDDLGGLNTVMREIQEHIYLPLQNHTLFSQLNVTPPKGLLLTGPPGSGKTALGLGICKDIFLKFQAPFFFKTSTELIGGISGESEKNLRKLFKDATQTAPSIIFLDEIDAIAGSRDKASKEMERRVVSELLSSLDKLPPNVFIIAATSRPESLETAIRRGGRFDNEIILNVPDDNQRLDILQKLTKNNPIGDDVDLKELAKNCPGYVPADIAALIRKAGVLAVQRILNERQIQLEQQQYQDSDLNQEQNIQIENGEEQVQNQNMNNTEKMQQENFDQKEIEINQYQSDQVSENEIQEEKENYQLQTMNKNVYINKQDFQLALKQVQPTGKREGFTSIPEVSWEDIGGLKSLKEDLYNNIILPIVEPETFEKFNINSPAGVLLYGPPGCGKTLLAKAVANASRANFIAVKGPELLNKYVGESEKSVRSLFSRARSSSPCIIFFDELDALCPKRGSDGNQVTERVVNSLLAELDGVEARKQVYVIAATNRPDIIDPAMLRGGRLDKLLYVPLPDADDRLQILQASIRKMPQSNDVDLKAISHSKFCINYSGADLASITKEAGLLSILKKKENVGQDEIMEAFKKTQPSLSDHDRISYEKLQSNLRQSKHHIIDE